MKKLLVLVLAFVSFSCLEETQLSFNETNLKSSDNAIVEINVPNADGESLVSKLVNTKIENHIGNALNFSEDESDSISLSDAIKKFDEEYKTFKNDFEENALVWEAMFDGEVTYQSSEIISIAINSYLNTGGAHGNLNITLLNFDPVTGDLLNFDDLISNKQMFQDVAKLHFKMATEAKEESDFEDYFFGEEFHLPANIGFCDEGVILFYNVYEIASYAVGITEFTIPYEEVKQYIKVN